MPHSPEEKKRAITRLRRIRGQADALERAIEEGSECAAVLQQIAAIRGAVNGLMADVLESHLREGLFDPSKREEVDREVELDATLDLIRRYLK
ncbi:MAG: metal/formaldehyde-sensitive transcriptional repressor [Rhodanobacteraceae bacterium]|nr:metal/formaldehyde-sensitive transcriptional repressor [Xanthomonadales bacterium]MCP5477396.1 metal/formaldehyde-sensitive transcriptional repressor [Rhodanobacteraceae bacterium]HPF73270.1 metal/formaldehyde-sensitive transcriptional repressor [Xanthomonadaceae bacterium]HRX99227.1 metal/formaldehyde-sensitive transcriptional repressor [Xanthomonadaceae bacterium]